jgi:very-short-patch-repair endonuclease
MGNRKMIDENLKSAHDSTSGKVRKVTDGKVYGNMFEGGSHLVFEFAKELRKNMTEAEHKLWFHLRQGVGGLKFRRQHVLKNYIADFYCHKIKLVIEADGSIHKKADVKEYDEIREQNLKDWGYEVIRFTNDEILFDELNVLKRIVEVVDELKNKKMNEC